MKLPITAIIVFSGEDSLINSCLQSFEFCKEIIIIDNSDCGLPAPVAHGEKNVKVISTREANLSEMKVPIIEQVRQKLLLYGTQPWVAYPDPDEKICIASKRKFSDLFRDSKLGEIDIPHYYYLGSKRIKGTVWGGKKNKALFFRRNAVTFPKAVHTRPLLEADYRSVFISEEIAWLDHYWLKDMDEFWEKHNRYLLHEGEARYREGKRFDPFTLFYLPLLSLLGDFIKRKTFLYGKDELTLSCFYAIYLFRANLSLYTYQRKRNE